jgi:hypothetical protein
MNTDGGRRVGQSELRLSRRTGKSQPADRPYDSAPGREIPCALSGKAPLEVNALIAADFIRDRGILVVSQRGTMFSEPALTCAPLVDFFRELLSIRFYSEATERAHLAATEACHRELVAVGADLSAYNSTESAADFADASARCSALSRGMSTGPHMAPTWRRR